MRKLSGLIRVVALIAIAFTWACSSDDDPPPLAGEGDACSVSADCADGLLCRDDICVQQPTQPDAGGDADPDGAQNNENNLNNMNNLNNVSGEEFYISFELDGDEGRELRLLNSETGENIQLNPAEVTCSRGCWVTDDLSHMVYGRQNAGAEDVFARPIDPTDFSVGAETQVVSMASEVRIDGSFVSYSRNEDGSRIAYYREIPDGPETEIGVIGASDNNFGTWHIDPPSGTAVLYTATLQTMDIRIGEMGTPIASDPVYTVDSSGAGGVGSFFSSSIPSAVSKDGKVLSLLLNAPFEYQACQSNADCTAPGHRCGDTDRCIVQEHVVLFVDLEATDNLGTSCSGDAACGEVHTCDIPSDVQLDQATCIPRRISLGLPGGIQQGSPSQQGCALTAGDLEAYTTIKPPMTYGADGSAYVVGSRSCAEDGLNIPKSDILRLDPRDSDFSIVFGNPGNDFDDALCFDEENEVIDITDCEIVVDRAWTSPGGNTVTFLGTNPNVLDPSLAASTLDLWTVLRNGEDKKWIGQHSQFEEVLNLRTHALP